MKKSLLLITLLTYSALHTSDDLCNSSDMANQLRLLNEQMEQMKQEQISVGARLDALGLMPGGIGREVLVKQLAQTLGQAEGDALADINEKLKVIEAKHDAFLGLLAGRKHVDGENDLDISGLEQILIARLTTGLVKDKEFMGTVGLQAAVEQGKATALLLASRESFKHKTGKGAASEVVQDEDFMKAFLESLASFIANDGGGTLSALVSNQDFVDAVAGYLATNDKVMGSLAGRVTYKIVNSGTLGNVLAEVEAAEEKTAAQNEDEAVRRDSFRKRGSSIATQARVADRLKDDQSFLEQLRLAILGGSGLSKQVKEALMSDRTFIEQMQQAAQLVLVEDLHQELQDLQDRVGTQENTSQALEDMLNDLQSQVETNSGQLSEGLQELRDHIGAQIEAVSLEIRNLEKKIQRKKPKKGTVTQI